MSSASDELLKRSELELGAPVPIRMHVSLLNHDQQSAEDVESGILILKQSPSEFVDRCEDQPITDKLLSRSLYFV